MTPANILFILAGAVALILGLVTLLRPSLVRHLLSIRAGEPAKYAMLIAGMMLAAFGLLLGGFAIGYATTGPLPNDQASH